MNFGKKNIIWALVLMVIIIAGAVFFWHKKVTNSLNNNEHFSIIDDSSSIMIHQDLSEINIMEDAVNYYQEKILEYEKLIPTVEDDLVKKDYYNDLALFYSKLGRYQEAYDSYMKSLDLSFVNRKTWISLGDLLVKMKAYKSAEQAYFRGNEINPYEQANYVKLADLYMMDSIHNQDDVLAIYDQGINLIEAPDLLYLHKGEYYEFLGRYGEAINMYKAWLNIAQEENKVNIQNKIDKLENKLE